MGIISNIKSTYQFAKSELKGDLKRNPTTYKAIKKGKKVISDIKSYRPKKPKISVKKGKKLPTASVVRGLKKKVGLGINYKKAKYKKKTAKQIRKESFSMGINFK